MDRIDEPLTRKIIDQCGLKDSWTDGEALTAALRTFLSDEIHHVECKNTFPKSVLGNNFDNVASSNKSLLAFARRLLAHYQAGLVRKRTHQARIDGKHMSYYAYKFGF